MFNCFPDAELITDIDPIQKLWMYENWVQDQADEAELAKNHAYLVGSFTNPEAAKQLMGDGSAQHVSSDEEFEESSRIVRESRNLSTEAVSEPIKRKKRRLVKE